MLEWVSALSALVIALTSLFGLTLQYRTFKKLPRLISPADGEDEKIPDKSIDENFSLLHLIKPSDNPSSELEREILNIVNSIDAGEMNRAMYMHNPQVWYSTYRGNLKIAYSIAAIGFIGVTTGSLISIKSEGAHAATLLIPLALPLIVLAVSYPQYRKILKLKSLAQLYNNKGIVAQRRLLVRR